MTMTQTELQDRIIAKATEDSEFRTRLVADPRAAIREATGEAIPVHVHEENATSFHIVLPADGRLTEEEMGQVSGGDDPMKDLSDFVIHD